MRASRYSATDPDVKETYTKAADAMDKAVEQAVAGNPVASDLYEKAADLLEKVAEAMEAKADDSVVEALLDAADTYLSEARKAETDPDSVDQDKLDALDKSIADAVVGTRVAEVYPEGLPAGHSLEEVNGTLVHVDAAGNAVIDAVNFPAEAIKDYVASEADKDGDGVLSDEERVAVAEIVMSDGAGVDSLAGLDIFENLTTINIPKSELTEVDISNLSKLEKLYVSEAPIETVILGDLSKLRVLDLRKTDITELDLSGCPAIQRLRLNNAKLTELDVSHLDNLIEVQFNYSLLTELDLSNKSKLEAVYAWGGADLITLNVSNCPALKELQIGGTRVEELDLSSATNLWSLGVNSTGLSELNIENNTKLINLNFGGIDNLTSVSYTVLPSLQTLTISPQAQFLMNDALLQNVLIFSVTTTSENGRYLNGVGMEIGEGSEGCFSYADGVVTIGSGLLLILIPFMQNAAR